MILSYLIPCPGPQAMRSIHKLVLPWLTDMQSSPVIMVLWLIVTPVENCTLIPSVLGLPLGALIFTSWITTLLQWSTAMCIVWLSNDVIPLTTTLLDQLNDIDCIWCSQNQLLVIKIYNRYYHNALMIKLFYGKIYIVTMKWFQNWTDHIYFIFFSSTKTEGKERFTKKIKFHNKICIKVFVYLKKISVYLHHLKLLVILKGKRQGVQTLRVQKFHKKINW